MERKSFFLGGLNSFGITKLNCLMLVLAEFMIWIGDLPWLLPGVSSLAFLMNPCNLKMTLFRKNRVQYWYLGGPLWFIGECLIGLRKKSNTKAVTSLFCVCSILSLHFLNHHCSLSNLRFFPTSTGGITHSPHGPTVEPTLWGWDLL